MYDVTLVGRDRDTIYADFRTNLLPRKGDIVRIKADYFRKKWVERTGVGRHNFKEQDGYYRVIDDALFVVDTDSPSCEGSMTVVLKGIEICVERVVRSGMGFIRHPEDQAADQAAIKEEYRSGFEEPG